jgi:hypothetical protein
MASLTLVVESARIASQARVLMLYTQSAETPPGNQISGGEMAGKYKAVVYLTVSNISRI